MQEMQDTSSVPGVWKIPWSRNGQSTPVFLPGKFHGQRSLESYCPQGHKVSDTTEHSHTKGLIIAAVLIVFCHFCGFFFPLSFLLYSTKICWGVFGNDILWFFSLYIFESTLGLFLLEVRIKFLLVIKIYLKLITI